MSKQAIFEQLRRAGCTPTGALALMGNWQEESGLEACRLQGDFSPDRYLSKDYANKVDNGLISDYAFSHDGKGWGLAQWTYSTRKTGLLNFCRRHSISIANETAQVDYAIAELKTDYPTLWSFLCSCNEDQLYTATDRVCREFERPAVNNVAARFKAAKALRDELQGQATEGIDNSVTDINAGSKQWPPRMICKGMFGNDVAVLQALLIAHGYTLTYSLGIFGETTEAALKRYQADYGLDVDGICGPQTWAAITKI